MIESTDQQSDILDFGRSDNQNVSLEDRIKRLRLVCA